VTDADLNAKIERFKEEFPGVSLAPLLRDFLHTTLDGMFAAAAVAKKGGSEEDALGALFAASLGPMFTTNAPQKGEKGKKKKTRP